MGTSISITELMQQSGVKFGTSGARGLASAMTDRVCYAYTAAFLQVLEARSEIARGTAVALSGDLRPSTERILRAVAQAVADRGHRVVYAGRIPSPALALHGIREGIPTVMVTGSHIPDDRNGIKFNKTTGEILKPDEAAIRDQTVDLPDRFDAAGNLREPNELPEAEPLIARHYLERWVGAFGADALRGKRVGLYEHSAVGRDLIFEILIALGGEVVRLGRSDTFVAVDTEAIRPEDIELGRRWAQEHRLDALISTDGDSDRPLVSDENGEWIRGDVAGVLVARFLNADVVVTPVNSNTAAERCGAFERVVRTRIGSPFVIEAMHAAVAGGNERVVGYEGNGGFLTASDLSVGPNRLPALPTRDPVIVALSLLVDASLRGVSISELSRELPRRFTASDRLTEFPTEVSQLRLRRWTEGGPTVVARDLNGVLLDVVALDHTDGVRATASNGEIVHVRPSGNAPELRCYVEADSLERSQELLKRALDVLSLWRS